MSQEGIDPRDVHKNMRVQGDDEADAKKRDQAVHLDKQLELEAPETKADSGYDENVTCKTPLKYIVQKWCCRRKR